jgi:hypothetical protein
MPIEPDTKNWTWVLERRCPECGFDTGSLSGQEVAALLRANIVAWPAVLARPDVRDRPDDATWSPLEYAAHVRDVFTLYLERLRLMLEHDDPLFADWDQDAAALAERYDLQDPATVSRELVVAGEELATAFDGVAGDQWDRPGRRSDGVSFTVSSFARYFVHDPVHHLFDVRR